MNFEYKLFNYSLFCFISHKPRLYHVYVVITNSRLKLSRVFTA